MLISLLISLCSSCSENCTLCTSAGQFWRRYFSSSNGCDGTICQDSSSFCHNNCSTCLYDGSKFPCSASPASVCLPAPICGPSAYSSGSGNISVAYPFPAQTMCSWTLDLRGDVRYPSISSAYLLISLVGSLEATDSRQKLTVLAYNLPSSISDYSMLPGTVVAGNWSTGIWLSYNLLVVTFATGDREDYDFPGIFIIWDYSNQNYQLGVQGVIAIITVSVVLFLCCSCCLFCCFKCAKSIRHRTAPQGPERARIYQVLPDNSLLYVSEENMNSCVPVVEFRKELIEVGENACPICFEE
jgi:hypothetical protein